MKGRFIMINGLWEIDELKEFILLFHLTLPNVHGTCGKENKLEIFYSKNKGMVDTHTVENKLIFSINSGRAESREKIWMILYPGYRYALVACNGNAHSKDLKKFLKNMKRRFSSCKQLPFPSGFEGVIFCFDEEKRNSERFIFPEEDIKEVMGKSELAKEIYHYVYEKRK